MTNILIVDDEPLALDVLETYLQRLPDLNLVRRCANAFEAMDALRQHDIDLMFLDIQMPQLTGIDFLKSLSRPPKVIFTTAFSDYALDGFELNVVDYLLKPISFDRFMKAVNKALDQLSMEKEKHAPAPKPLAPAGEPTDEKEDYIFIKSDKKFIKIKYTDILYIEGLKDYVIIWIPTGRIITLQTMKSLEEKLPHDRFRRVHRSYIVQMEKVEAIVGNMVEVNKKHIPVGKNYRDELLEMVNKNKL